MPRSPYRAPSPSPLWTAAVVALCVLPVTSACDWTVGTPTSDADARAADTLQTQILNVKVQPSPIPPGDTATFTAVLADSTDASFQFRWYLAGMGPVILTETNQVRWPAPEQTGSTAHVVVADNGTDSLAAPSREFAVTVE